MRCLALGLFAVLTVGCSFDDSGIGGGGDHGLGTESEGSDGSDSGSTGGATGEKPATEGDGNPSASTSRGDGTSTEGPGPATSGESSGGGESASESTGAMVDCSAPQTIELTVDDATVFEPMVTEVDQNEGTIAWSPDSNDGEIDFTFEVQCAGTYWLFGRVLDETPGVNPGDPDSFRIFHEGAGFDWFYGCQTFDLSGGWHWVQALFAFQGGTCGDAVPLEYELEPGEATIRLRNREAMTAEAKAAVAGVVVTSDASFSP